MINKFFKKPTPAEPKAQPKPESPKASSGSPKNLLSQVKSVLAIASAKGGVGKSTTTVKLAEQLQTMGFRVGIADLDIYGPSIPTMVDMEQAPFNNEVGIVPCVSRTGVKFISFAMFADSEKAAIFRGPVLGNLAKKMVCDVDWGSLDYLLLDMPPGTGDVQLSIAQSVSITGALLVTTPQKVSVTDVEKSVSMFRTLKIPILGVLENMSYFVCDGCDKKHYIFKQGGGQKMAQKLGYAFLGEVPIIPEWVEQCDSQQAIAEPKNSEFLQVCQNVLKSLETENSGVQGLESFVLNWRAPKVSPETQRL